MALEYREVMFVKVYTAEDVILGANATATIAISTGHKGQCFYIIGHLTCQNWQEMILY